LKTNGDYEQGDPSEFMQLLFFPNFECFQVDFMGQVGIVDDLTLTCVGGKTINVPENNRNQPVLQLKFKNNTKTSIQTLINEYIEVEPMDVYIDRCDGAKLQSQQHALNSKKYVIFHTERRAPTQTNPLARNTTPIEITSTITINGSNFRIKGCIFHSGSGGGGHYVYGVYDEVGAPAYVVNDIPTYKIEFDDVFGQRNGWLSTMYLYVRM
jgi:hypothetical protein